MREDEMCANWKKNSLRVYDEVDHKRTPRYAFESFHWFRVSRARSRDQVEPVIPGLQMESPGNPLRAPRSASTSWRNTNVNFPLIIQRHWRLAPRAFEYSEFHRLCKLVPVVVISRQVETEVLSLASRGKSGRVISRSLWCNARSVRREQEDTS